MAGLIRKIERLPTGKLCISCNLEWHEDIHYFLETGIFTEIEGPLFLCNRCFESQVLVSGEYLTKATFKEHIDVFKEEVQSKLNRLDSLEVAVGVLKREFKLDLEDLFNFDQLRKDYKILLEARNEINSELIACREEIAQAKATRRVLEDQYEEFITKVNEKNLEYNDLIETSLQRVLEKRGRADLVDIIFNNRIPEGIEFAPTGDESEVVELVGEAADSVFSGF